MRINGFEQIKGFYSWLFDNQDKSIKPHHIALYMFLINQNNRNNWAEWFKCPFDIGMAGSGIGSKKTYYRCLDELAEWDLLEYQKGVNEWKAAKIKLVVLRDNQNVPSSEVVMEEGFGVEPPASTLPSKPIELPEAVTKLTHEIATFFNINEHLQFKHFVRIQSFVSCLHKQGKLPYLTDQFKAYKHLKKDGNFKHSWNKYIGTAAEKYEDGAWNIKNWKAEVNGQIAEAPAYRIAKHQQLITEQKARENQREQIASPAR